MSSRARRSGWTVVATVVALVLALAACNEERVAVEPTVEPSVIGIIAEYTGSIGQTEMTVRLEDGRVLQFGPDAAQLSDQPPGVGLLLLAGEDELGQWLLPVGGRDVFVLHGTGWDEVRNVVVRPDPPSVDPGPARLVRLPKSPDFFGGPDEERGIYDSPRGTFGLDASGAVIRYQP